MIGRPKIIGIDSGCRCPHIRNMSNPLNCTKGLMHPNGRRSRRQIVLQLSTPRRNEIRTAEVIGSRCLATDLAIGLPIEHLPQRASCWRCRVDRLGLEAGRRHRRNGAGGLPPRPLLVSRV